MLLSDIPESCQSSTVLQYSLASLELAWRCRVRTTHTVRTNSVKSSPRLRYVAYLQCRTVQCGPNLAHYITKNLTSDPTYSTLTVSHNHIHTLTGREKKFSLTAPGICGSKSSMVWSGLLWSGGSCTTYDSYRGGADGCSKRTRRGKYFAYLGRLMSGVYVM